MVNKVGRSDETGVGGGLGTALTRPGTGGLKSGIFL